MMTTTMYSVVFGSAWVKCAVLVLLAFLLLQPASMAFADTEAQDQAGEPPAASEAIEMEESVPEEEPEPEQSESVVEEAQEGPSSEPTTDEQSANDQIEPDASLENNNSNDTAATTADPDDSVADETHTSATSTPEEVPSGSDNEAEQGEEDVEAETTPPIQDEPEPAQQNGSADTSTQEETTPAATSTETATTSENVLVVDHNANQLKFDQKECASVGDGAFYCSSPTAEVEDLESGVFAAPDSDGDMEIFVRLDGEQKQLTSNQIDDNAPFYDALSDRIVWHAMLNDRYQIMSYDMQTEEVTQLTNSSYNNMEPVAYGDITMYQSWLDNNWEIIRNQNGNEERLTHNQLHDVSPNIRGGYTVWQSQFTDGWQVAVYDQETGHVEYVESEGGAKVENPRFVLVYDSTNDAGDIQTVGYDFDNKRSFTLNSLPADLPDELPEPDQTGETRALIQSKHTIRGSEIEETDVVPTNSNTSSSTATSTGNSIPEVDLTASSTPASSTSTPEAASIEDLIIPSPQTASTTLDISHIPDVLIPPLEATSSAEMR